MKKCIIFITVILCLTVPFTFADDLVDLESSNQSAATIGFEQNQYDWLINPIDFGKITQSTLFLICHNLLLHLPLLFQLAQKQSQTYRR